MENVCIGVDEKLTLAQFDKDKKFNEADMKVIIKIFNELGEDDQGDIIGIGVLNYLLDNANSLERKEYIEKLINKLVNNRLPRI